MTESKQDIQAQIDQLDLEWLRNLDGYKIKHHWGSLITPVAGSPMDQSMRLVLNIFVPVGFIWYLWKMGPTALESLNEGGTVLGIPFLPFLFSGFAIIVVFVSVLRARKKFLKAAVIYDEALKAYQQERSRLQSRLNSAKASTHD